jgi:hypothetical protein
MENHIQDDIRSLRVMIHENEISGVIRMIKRYSIKMSC